MGVANSIIANDMMRGLRTSHAFTAGCLWAPL